MEKLTQRTAFTELKAFAVDAGRTDLVEFLDKKIAQLDKKAAKASEPNPEFAVLEDKIVGVLTGTDGKLTADIAAVIGASTQKTAPRLKALVTAGTVVVETVKGKNFYKLA